MLNTMTGNRALFKIGGTIIGTAQDVTISDDSGLLDVRGLGEPEALEFVAGAISHSITGSKYFVQNSTLVKLGFVPTANEWLTAPEFEVEIIDKVSGGTSELYTGCKFGTHSRDYKANSICGENFTIRARHKEI